MKITEEMVEVAWQVFFDGYLARYKGAMRSALEAALAAAPTPPAQEDVPVALVRYGIKWQGLDKPICVQMNDGYWTPWHVADMLVNADRPDDAKLRKAVTELLARWDRRTYEDWDIEMESLRAASEQK